MCYISVDFLETQCRKFFAKVDFRKCERGLPLLTICWAARVYTCVCVCVCVIPVRKLMMRSTRKTVSEMLLKTIQCVLRSSLKNEMATGRMTTLAINNTNMNKSQ